MSGQPFRKAPSLFCFALMMPRGPEVALLEAQHAVGAGIFSCEEWRVFSNVSTPGSHGQFQTSSIGGALAVPRGGRFRSLLNAAVFVRVWRSVFQEGCFRRHAWTAKVDPDTVFLPSRLRGLLHVHDSGFHSAVYLLNAVSKLWGSIEVLSAAAVETFAAGMSQCEAEVGCQGRGEDWYLHLCLDLLGARAFREPLLLAMRSRGTSGRCNGSVEVALHAFKRPAQLLGCLRRIVATANDSDAAVDALVSSWGQLAPLRLPALHEEDLTAASLEHVDVHV
eukprot:CAMPEP_0172820236 /NCGR_PEP_ID=MMETSP1075-20121228/15128_1 /TAXON_ID=2916 /ORGANISM="Ceratium fusus, Strain PA161109" /LENGTH=278 /DNA_ID=CAMNT_0013660873 /DNA_START=74 /DNA_END=906 /DNA_ORIENTATION=-